MSMSFLKQVKTAISNLNPDEIRRAANRPVRILVQAGSSASYAAVEDFLAPAKLSGEKRMEAAHMLVRACDAGSDGRFHLVFFERGTPAPEGWAVGVDAFRFDAGHPSRLVRDVLEHKAEYGLALARIFPAFRTAAIENTIQTVARENALFSIMTALPNVLPSLAELPWAVGEFASDTAVLTANQIRMAFLLSAASDREVGYREQRSEIGSIIAGAWGWRAAARQLSGKIPFGGGLIPKAAIAYAGTYVVGLSLERVYRIGYGLTRDERKDAYEAALARGKDVAAGLLARVRGAGGSQA
jgi:hypothetical protein